MQLPPPDRFRHDPYNPEPPRCWASVPGTSYDVIVPSIGDDDEPDPPSLALAAEVLPQLDALVDEAAEHIRYYADAQRLGLQGRPDAFGVYCDAQRRRVEVSVNWQVHLYTLWTVTFHLHENGRRYPILLTVKPH